MINDWLEINGKQMIQMAKTSETVKFKIYARKIIYAYLKILLIPKNNRNQNKDESYTNKYQNHVGCNYSYKLICFDGQFSKFFKSYLGKGAVDKFISSMVKESKYCSCVMKNYLDKEIPLTKEDDKILKDLKNVGLNCKRSIVLQNLKNYDGHLVMQELGKLNSKINVIFNGLEKYMITVLVIS